MRGRNCERGERVDDCGKLRCVQARVLLTERRCNVHAVSGGLLQRRKRGDIVHGRAARQPGAPCGLQRIGSLSSRHSLVAGVGRDVRNMRAWLVFAHARLARVLARADRTLRAQQWGCGADPLPRGLGDGLHGQHVVRDLRQRLVREQRCVDILHARERWVHCWRIELYIAGGLPGWNYYGAHGLVVMRRVCGGQLQQRRRVDVVHSVATGLIHSKRVVDRSDFV